MRIEVLLGRLTAGIYPNLQPAELPRLARDVAFVLVCVGSLAVMLLLVGCNTDECSNCRTFCGDRGVAVERCSANPAELRAECVCAEGQR